MIPPQLLLSAIFWIYVVIALIAIFLAFKLPKSRNSKLAWGVPVLGLFSILPIQAIQELREEQALNEAYQVRLAKAQKLFHERCKAAGEKIYKRVEGVEAITLINPRGAHKHSNYGDRNWEGAGFPGESGGNQYIVEFLFYNLPPRGNFLRTLTATPDSKALKGYRYVDVKEGESVRRFALRKTAEYGPGHHDPIVQYGVELPAQSPFPRHAVVYENIPDPEGRESWIAGGRVKVVDQTTGEVLGEFTRYAFERGFGSTAGNRSPWLFARDTQCPPNPADSLSFGHIRHFVDQVIKPKQEE